MPVRFQSRGAASVSTDLCEPRLNLLAHAQAIELEIGSRCGGHGECGGDRVRLPLDALARFSAPSAAERELLSSVELAQGVRLACQCYPDLDSLDVTLEIFPAP